MFKKTKEMTEPLRAAIRQAYRADETHCVEQLVQQAQLPSDMLSTIANNARQLIAKVRDARMNKGGLDAFLYQYDLSSEEGIALMCLAESMLRIPDSATADRLIRDKISSADWTGHLGQSHSFFVNAATWGLMLTGKIFSPPESKGLGSTLKRFIERTSEPVVRQVIGQAMKKLGEQFVMGHTIDAALKRATAFEKQGYRFSYDMLGEAARTADDAERYFQSYQKAIDAVGKGALGKGFKNAGGISIKLSALHPRYEFSQHAKVLHDIVPKLRELALQAKACDIGITIDAEEADRLDLSLDIIEAVFSDPALKGWDGFGVAVQSYQKRAPYVLDWLIDLARQHQRKIVIRLIKGAYWDSEIKFSQVQGLEGYPVFTRKISTDVSFLACARKIIAGLDVCYPQFGTHNAYSVAAVMELMKGKGDYEFQCLHGMGYTLYDQIVGADKFNIPCRVYAPVGGHQDLLAYLVRRLLENGANTSFVNRIIDEKTPIEDMIVDPVAEVAALASKPHPRIPLPCDIYGDYRKNSRGLDLTNADHVSSLYDAMTIAMEKTWQALPLLKGRTEMNQSSPMFDPSDRRRMIGTVIDATEEQVELALSRAATAFAEWEGTAVEKRADCLQKAGELFEQHRAELMALIIREGGKTVPDALGEVREAIDFCYYYAAQARHALRRQLLPSPTGEKDYLYLHGRGVMACISPWNFPLAIFIGQVVAALVSGNVVLAKPAKQTPLIATLAVKLLHEAGIPHDVLQLLPGRGDVVGARLVADSRVKGIIFTGSTETARMINKVLADRPGALVPFIAETGGQNTMIVDSSALLEQVVVDVLSSAFNSAGQRCSALRVLFVQNEIADKFITMLKGAMAELQLGDPLKMTTDIGPVIDDGANAMLESHFARMQTEGKLIYQVPRPEETQHGTFFAPCAFEIDHLSRLQGEVFGPILHIIRYNAKNLDKVIADINQTGYGLTLGIHSRIDETIRYIQERVRVGNIYVNRNIIGAVVGVQPFGGEGLSGTGPKAGGPHYLQRLCTERVVSINTTATGGNATLMTLAE